MRLRNGLPMVGAALAFAIASGCSSNAPDRVAAPTEIRPAQMARLSECEELARRVEHRMPTAKAYRVPGAQNDLAEAQELCRSGQTEEGIGMLHGVLRSMDLEN